MCDPRNYTVGWICALSTEYVAAQVFLDERHDEGPAEVSPNDNNVYTLGRIGKHNIVIAALPDGEYGLSSAACVARDMLHSFPNVRIGLMVGIGGGAPSTKHDIRLGDIVVGASRDGKSSVFQYDFGKAIQGQAFRPTGFLNQSPPLLRAAVSGLMARYESDGHQIETSINSILEKKPRMRRKYAKPTTDRLYRTEFIHPEECRSCSETCDPCNLISRPRRDEYENSPMIHYGQIASANCLMKDAKIRDQLSKDVLCFEMEAAGLMNHFPCLVIRGICDYSDSHKNKEWQGYAAMAAAAYTKDLLCQIAPSRIESEKKITDVLAGTGQWLLDSPEFNAWVEGETKTLFCPGIPGAGKTILAAILIESLHSRFHDDPKIGIAYLYCNFRRQDEQKAEDLVASLLKQLAQRLSPFPECVKSLYDYHRKRSTLPHLDEVSGILQSVACLFSRVFLVIDALDECREAGSCRANFLAEIFSLQAKSRTGLLVTSRFVPEVVKIFTGSTTLEVRASKEDVQRYVSGHLGQLRPFVAKNRQLQEEIKTSVSEAVDGMFLLAQIYLSSLDDKITAAMIRKALRQLRKQTPSSSESEKLDVLNQAYTNTMDRVNEQKPGLRDLAQKVLSWITCARRPLATVELQHALAVTVGELEPGEHDPENEPQTEDMVSVCAGLVAVDEESGIIRLVHYTTQEFFERTRNIWFPNADANMAQICLTYISYDTFSSGFRPSDEEFEWMLESNALYDYAARNWGYHARAASIEAKALELEQPMLRFLKSKAKVSSCAQVINAPDSRSPSYSQYPPNDVTGIHLAVLFGLSEMIKILSKDGYPLDSKDTDGRTPLSWAAENGDEAVVKLLVERNVEIESVDSYAGQTPLSWAARYGQIAAVKLLLEAGAEIETKDKNDDTPLLWAIRSGHVAVVKFLLASGAELKVKNKIGRTPLVLSIFDEQEEMVRLLLKSGAETEVKDKDGRTALFWAVEIGKEIIVRLLLGSGAETEVKEKDGGTVLFWAVMRGKKAMVRLLLESGAEREARDKEESTPLLQAAAYGHRAMVKLLLKSGAEKEAKDIYGRTSLFWAAMRGYNDVVGLLLKSGAEAEVKDIEGRTPLFWAAVRGHKAVVETLLESGARK
ncbi:hypothetical protein TWF694_006002 [Orbilia ellipsospora]|uniref:NACHT domain-containing protein n=1 Tax=Orbilia ellipsospora TaxID=2528407 RepID=A0AAV9WRY5_9PEZI